MINKIGQIMLYVNNQEASVKFWTETLGFTLISTEDNGHMKWYEIAASPNAETTIILHDKELIAKMSPELNLGTPSLMFATNNFDELFEKLTSNNVTVGEIIAMPSGRVFNFADAENNYFAVAESK